MPDAPIHHVVGNLSWDRLVEVPTFPERNQDYLTLTDVSHAGGAGGNVAAGLALLGLESTIVAAVGLDDQGSGLVEEIRTYGVDTAFVQTVAASTSEFICRINPQGDRSFLINPEQAAFMLAVEETPSDRAASYVFVGCRLSAAEEIVARSSPARSRTFANIGFWIASRELTEESASLLLHMDCLFLNSDEFGDLPEALKEVLRSPEFLEDGRKVVITGGATEAVVLQPEGSLALAPSRAPAIANTLGCGDAFMAGYIAAHVKELDVAKCLRVAHDCAGRIAESPLERHRAQFDGIRLG